MYNLSPTRATGRQDGILLPIRELVNLLEDWKTEAMGDPISTQNFSDDVYPNRHQIISKAHATDYFPRTWMLSTMITTPRCSNSGISALMLSYVSTVHTLVFMSSTSMACLDVNCVTLPCPREILPCLRALRPLLPSTSQYSSADP